MTLAAYTGHEALTFPDYLDLETGQTLHAEPGGTYDVAPASGRVVADLPAGWFTPVAAEDASGEGEAPPEAEAGQPAEGEPAAEPGEAPDAAEPQQS